MASRIIHLAVANELTKRRAIPEPERFFLGSILPDACEGKQAHFNRLLAGGTRKTHDLSGFRRVYGDKLKSDSLYLGFYLHLLQDVLHRNEMYEQIGFDPLPPGNVPRLHADYRLINRCVIDKYGLTNRVALPREPEREPLFQSFRFALEPFLAELERDFSAMPEGETVFFTEKDADRLISRSVESCLRELDALQTGAGYFDEERFAWKRRMPGPGPGSEENE